MGVSTDASICFGIEIGEDTYNMPWYSEDDGYCEDEKFVLWWLEKNGFEPSEHEDEFLKKHPLPVEIVTHCSYDYPMYILAAVGTETTASRGYAQNIDDSLKGHEEAIQKLLEFIKEENVELEGEPSWLLYSMWG